MKEIMKNPGCGIAFLVAGLTQMDNPKFYTNVLKKHGEPGLDQILLMYHEQLSQLPTEIINNPQKVSQMRQAVAETYRGTDEQIKKQAADKVVTALESRLIAMGLSKRESEEIPTPQAKIDFGVDMGSAVKACLDFPRLAMYALPIVRSIESTREIREYGEPQQPVNPDLFLEICGLVE